MDRTTTRRVLDRIMTDAKSIRRLCHVLEERLADGPVPQIQAELQNLQDHADRLGHTKWLLRELWTETNPFQEVSK